MHTDLLDIFVKRIRTRVSQMDCPTEPALSTENLEDAVLALADEVERLTRDRDNARAGRREFVDHADLEQLTVVGRGHPPVMLGVGDVPRDDDTDPTS